MGVSANHLKEVLILRNKHVSISLYLFKIDVLHHIILFISIYRLSIYTDAATIFVIGLILLFHCILQQVFCERCESVLVRNLMLMLTAFLIWCNQIQYTLLEKNCAYGKVCKCVALELNSASSRHGQNDILHHIEIKEASSFCHVMLQIKITSYHSQDREILLYHIRCIIRYKAMIRWT